MPAHIKGGALFFVLAATLGAAAASGQAQNPATDVARATDATPLSVTMLRGDGTSARSSHRIRPSPSVSVSAICRVSRLHTTPSSRFFFRPA